ncbi:MAG: alternate-type signal peptide domain-containing protein [Brevibacterium sp.]
MKNSTKALIAGGVGVALLVGGAGTVAFWTDSEDGGEGVITAGNLDLGDLGDDTGDWTIQHLADPDNPDSATDPEPFDPKNHHIVPGDILSFTQNVPVTLDGKNIAAHFVGDVTVEAGSGAGSDELAKAIEKQDLATVEATDATTPLQVDGDDIVTGQGTGEVEVTTSVTFPWGTEGQYNDARLGSLSFKVDYTLTQVPGN